MAKTSPEWLYENDDPSVGKKLMDSRTNFISKTLDVRNTDARKPVYVYEDHRCLLNVLYQHRIDGILTSPVSLVYFDYHADDKQPSQDATFQAMLAAYRKQLPPEREFWTFVEWDVDLNDGDWLKVGMELGLIEHAIVVGCYSYDSAAHGKTTFKDHTQHDHYIFNFGHVWDGWLTDPARKQHCSEAWQMLGWELSHGEFSFGDSKNLPHPIVLDFDLDCFSSKAPEKHIPWPSNYFGHLFGRPLDTAPEEACCGRFVQTLAARSEFVTIARESAFCGGFDASARLLNLVDSLLFNGLLTEMP